MPTDVLNQFESNDIISLRNSRADSRNTSILLACNKQTAIEDHQQVILRVDKLQTHLLTLFVFVVKYLLKFYQSFE